MTEPSSSSLLSSSVSSERFMVFSVVSHHGQCNNNDNEVTRGKKKKEKKKKRKRKILDPGIIIGPCVNGTGTGARTDLLRVHSLREQMKSSEWFGNCSHLLKAAWSTFSSKEDEDDHVENIVCLGLGSPTLSKNSRVQLAFLLEMCSVLDSLHSAISVYDPIFTPDDLALFSEMQINVLEYTSALNPGHASKTHVSSPKRGTTPPHLITSGPTIYFMPHCDLELYESLLSVNRDVEHLSMLFLVGNSLQAYLDNRPKSFLESVAPNLVLLAPELTDISLPECKVWPTAFNNTSIQFISRS